jgi:hypothetical protein
MRLLHWSRLGTEHEKLHIPRQLERKFEVIVLAESARMELKSSANES